MSDKTKLDGINIGEIDFSEEYAESLAPEYTRQVAAEIADEKGYEKVPGSEATYVESHGWIRPNHELAVQGEGVKLKYNERLISNGDIYDAMKEMGEKKMQNPDITKLLEQTE